MWLPKNNSGEPIFISVPGCAVRLLCRLLSRNGGPTPQTVTLFEMTCLGLWSPSAFPLDQLFAARGEFCRSLLLPLPRHLVLLGHIFWLLKRGLRGGVGLGGATGIQWVEAGDAAARPTVLRVAPRPRAAWPTISAALGRRSPGLDDKLQRKRDQCFRSLSRSFSAQSGYVC